jgi:hypoxanthine-guanine phosphoribosyltransferase
MRAHVIIVEDIFDSVITSAHYKTDEVQEAGVYPPVHAGLTSPRGRIVPVSEDNQGFENPEEFVPRIRARLPEQYRNRRTSESCPQKKYANEKGSALLQVKE